MKNILQFKENYLDIDNIDKVIDELCSKAMPILNNRSYLYDRYTRENDKEDVVVALEYYITTIATGYFGGKEPQYKVQVLNETQKGILKEIFGREYTDKNKPENYQAIIDYITKYNDNGSFFYELVKDYMITGACYGLIYENLYNEIVYSPVSSLQTIAIWNYDTPKQKIGLLRCWEEDTGTTKHKNVEIITKNYKRRYIDNILEKNRKKLQPVEVNEVNWDDVPIFAVENSDGLGIFENVIKLIKKFEQIIKNNANTFQYNDDAKLQVTGFTPTNDTLIEKRNEEGMPILDENGNPEMVENPARKKEDEAILKSKIFYTPEATGRIEWIIKNLNDTASENHKKTCLDLALMVSGVPNVTDQGFTNADNSSALEKKFFPLEQVLQEAGHSFKKELLRMWEIITARINLKKLTDFNFRDIEIILTRNIPANNSEVVNNWLKLRGLLSDKTIIEHIPYDLDSESELAEIDKQNQENIIKNMETMQLMNRNEDSNDKNGEQKEKATTEDVEKLKKNKKINQEIPKKE